MDKGLEGLEGYSDLLSSISTVLTRNNDLTTQLGNYHRNLDQISKKTGSANDDFKVMDGEVTQQ